MTLLALLLVCLVQAGGTCIVIHGDRITAGDLAAALPAFAALAPSEPLAYAPEPPVTRTLNLAELRRLAARHGLPGNGLHEVCLARETRLLTAAEILTALRAAPGLNGARIELVDFLHAPVPPGRLELAPTGVVLPPPSDPSRPILWRGRIRYSSTRTATFWVRFRALVRRRQVVATTEIRSGAPIALAQLRVEEAEVSPFAPPVCEAIDCAAGKIPWRTFHAREVIRPEMVRAAPAIARGDMVTVEVKSGQATVKATARAETGGVAGRRVTLINEATQKRFSAIVTGPRQARIDYGEETRHAASSKAHSDARPVGGVAAGGRQEAEAAHPIADRSIPE